MLVYQEPLVQVRHGHVLDELDQMDAGSCQLCLTSPPYLGLRSYQVAPVVWGGDPSCQHQWGPAQQKYGGGGQPGEKVRWQHTGHGVNGHAPADAGTFCQHCSAWLGSLGLEPRPWCPASLLGDACTDQCYLGHLLVVCDGIFRVLRDDGCLVWNMGDSYASSPVGTFNGGSAYMQSRWNKTAGHAQSGRMDKVNASGLKPKNLLNLPARFSIAMQGRGWILRNSFQWLKDNCMPGSQTDRPTVSHEWMFIFVKTGRVYWDAEAVRMPNSSPEQAQHNQRYAKSYAVYDERAGATGQPGNVNHVGIHARGGMTGRTRRTGDWWDESLDLTIADMEAWVQHAKQVREHGGLLLSPEGEPLGLHVNPQPTKLAHFAAFPSRLVRPFILAATSEVGCCERCQTPWKRIVASEPDHSRGEGLTPKGNHQPDRANFRTNPPSSRHTTLGWAPGCACEGAAVVPCVVLDPFAGIGRVAQVARSLGRQSVAIDLSAEYCELMKETLHANLPLFDADEQALEQIALGLQNMLLFDVTD